MFCFLHCDDAVAAADLLVVAMTRNDTASRHGAVQIVGILHTRGDFAAAEALISILTPAYLQVPLVPQ